VPPGQTERKGRHLPEASLQLRATYRIGYQARRDRAAANV
jgi:hypothetical protein